MVFGTAVVDEGVVGFDVRASVAINRVTIHNFRVTELKMQFAKLNSLFSFQRALDEFIRVLRLGTEYVQDRLATFPNLGEFVLRKNYEGYRVCATTRLDDRDLPVLQIGTQYNANVIL